MATVLSTTALTADESASLDVNANRIAHTNELIASVGARVGYPDKESAVVRLQGRLTMLQAAYQADMLSVLAARVPPVDVPEGATVDRQTIADVDSLVVTSA